MAQAHVVSINKIRADAVRVTRGFFILAWLPAFILVMLLTPAWRGLLPFAPVPAAVIWLLVVLTLAGVLLTNFGIARMTAPYLWALVGGLAVTAIGVAVLVVTLGSIVAQKSSAAWVFVAAFAITFVK